MYDTPSSYLEPAVQVVVQPGADTAVLQNFQPAGCLPVDARLWVQELRIYMNPSDRNPGHGAVATGTRSSAPAPIRGP